MALQCPERIDIRPTNGRHSSLSVILVIFRFGFEGWIWVLIASVPGLCIRFTFNKDSGGI